MDVMRIAFPLVALIALAGCGADDEEPAATTPPPSSPEVVLDIRFDDGDGETDTASLRCAAGEPEAEGYLSGADAAELCASALELDSLLTEEPPARRVCTQIFGGPQTARVTGTLDGEDVDRRFSRENGCRIAEWDRLQRAGLLPGP
ncbi:MAG: hypothetical protein WD844_06810 [Thermoleophilaceae bacterium]